MNGWNKFFLAAAVVVSLAACKPAKPDGKKAGGQSNPVENGTSHASSPAADTTSAVSDDAAPASKNLHSLSGVVTSTRSYCGGAAPSEAMLQKFRMPIPVSGMKFHLRKGNTNDLSAKIIGTCTTDAEGKFSIQLPDGEYCLINDERVRMPDEKQLTANTSLHYGEECQAEWILQCDASFVISGKDLTLDTLRYHERCFVSYLSPCIRYTGPMPP